MLKKRSASQADLDTHRLSPTEELEAIATAATTTTTTTTTRVPLFRVARKGVCSYGRNSRTPRSFEASLNDSLAGFDATSLNVMHLGPLTGLHRSNNGGVCQLFANFIVGSVAHACEHDSASANGDLTTEFFVRRECIFASAVPRRTKFKPVQTNNCFDDVVNRRPLAFIWTDPVTGSITRVTEFVAIKRMLVELYTRLLVNSEAFHALLNMLRLGYDINITGDTDCVPLDTETMEPEMWRCINWEAIVANELNTRIDSF